MDEFQKKTAEALADSFAFAAAAHTEQPAGYIYEVASILRQVANGDALTTVHFLKHIASHLEDMLPIVN